MENDDLKIHANKVANNAAVALAKQTVVVQREVAEELRKKSPVDPAAKQAFERQAEPPVKEKIEPTSKGDGGKAPSDDDGGKEARRRSKLLLDIDA